MNLQCSSCNTENEPNSMFCTRCGTPFQNGGKKVKALDIIEKQERMQAVSIEEDPRMDYYSAGYAKGFKDGFAMRPEIEDNAPEEVVVRESNLLSRLYNAYMSNPRTERELYRNPALLNEGIILLLGSMILTMLFAQEGLLYGMAQMKLILGIKVMALLTFYGIVFGMLKLTRKNYDTKILAGTLAYTYAGIDMMFIWFIGLMLYSYYMFPFTPLFVLLIMVFTIYTIYVQAMTIQRLTKSSPIIAIITALVAMTASLFVKLGFFEFYF